MKLISPEFLRKVNDQWERDRVLNELFKGEETISIIMIKKSMSFDEACEWASQACYQQAAPEANEAQKEVMKRVAKELISEWRG